MATTLFLSEIVLGAGWLIVGTVLFVRGKRHVGLRFVGGWLAGLLAGCVFLRVGPARSPGLTGADRGAG